MVPMHPYQKLLHLQINIFVISAKPFQNYLYTFVHIRKYLFIKYDKSTNASSFIDGNYSVVNIFKNCFEKVSAYIERINLNFSISSAKLIKIH